MKHKGFTIIEVVLVLAITGVIFAIVFLALPALRSSRRDTQRKDDVSKVVAAAVEYASKHSGMYPVEDGTSFSVFVNSYFNTDDTDLSKPVLQDPQESAYTFVEGVMQPAVPEMSYVYGQGCDGTSTNKTVSVRAGLEQGGFYCQDNR